MYSKNMPPKVHGETLSLDQSLF